MLFKFEMNQSLRQIGVALSKVGTIIAMSTQWIFICRKTFIEQKQLENRIFKSASRIWCNKNYMRIFLPFLAIDFFLNYHIQTYAFLLTDFCSLVLLLFLLLFGMRETKMSIDYNEHF